MKLIYVSVLKEWVENWFTKNRLYHPYAKNNNIPITELYDILEQMPSARPEQPKSCNECENFNKTMRLIYSAQPEQRWIPCSERLPEEKDAGILKKLGTEKRSEYVLATVDVKGERMTVTACTYDGKWDWKMKYAFPEHEIVAWMPLPEPYGGEQER